jgi:hypothetical protein
MTEFTRLSQEDKISILNERIRALEYNLYNLQVGLIEENARENVIQENIDNISSEILETNRCIDALKSALASLT